MAKRLLRVGVVGAGFMGGMHLEGITRMLRGGLVPGLRLAGIAGLNPEKGRKLAATHDCPWFDGGESLIASPETDVIVLASPTDTRLPLVRACARHGKPVFLEKPLGRNLAEARKVAQVIRKAELPHQLGLVLRFAPTYVVLKKLLEDKSDGEFLACRFRDDQFFPVRDIYDSNWRSDVEVAGGGTLIEHSIHDVDVLHWFFGPPRLTDALITPSHAPGIEKLACLQMRFPSGGVGQLTSVWHSNKGRDNHRDIEIFCENRSFRTGGEFLSSIRVQGPTGPEREITAEEVRARFLKSVGWKNEKDPDFPVSIGYELYVFLRSLMRGGQCAVPVETGLAAHELIEKAYRAGRGKMGR